MRQRLPARNVILPIVGVLILLAVWQIVGDVLGPYRMPGPLKVLPGLLRVLSYNNVLAIQGGGSHGALGDLAYTTAHTLEGVGLGTVVGVIVGLSIGASSSVRAILEVPIELGRSVPPLAAIPFLLLWFGATPVGQLVMVTFYSFVMVAINTVEAVKVVDPVYARYAASLGACRRDVYRKVVLPSILPPLIGGIRVGLGMSWGIQVVAELMGSHYGIGAAFQLWLSMQDTPSIIQGIIWIVIIAWISDALLVAITYRFTNWMPRTRYASQNTP